MMASKTAVTLEEVLNLLKQLKLVDNDINKTELLLAAAIADIPLENETDRTFPLPVNLPPRQKLGTAHQRNRHLKNPNHCSPPY